MQRSSPDASTGLRMFDASIEPPLVAPAPTTVWISSMNRMAPGLLAQRRQHALQPLLEIAAEARAGQQRAHVERVDLRVLQRRRHLALVDLQRQPLGERRLADAGLADEDRVVLAPPAEHVRRARQLLLAADQRIDLALGGARHQIGGVERQRILLRTCLLVLVGLTRRSASPSLTRGSSAIFETPCEM